MVVATKTDFICNVDTFVDRGVECVVFDIGEGMVLKLYLSYEEAYDAYVRASIAAQHGIGPVVYGEVIEHYCDYLRGRYPFTHGYITEKVELLSDELIAEHFDDNWEVLYNDHSDFADEYFKLKATLVEIFGDWDDLHDQNLGFNKNGKLVAIDFGEASLG